MWQVDLMISRVLEGEMPRPVVDTCYFDASIQEAPASGALFVTGSGSSWVGIMINNSTPKVVKAGTSFDDLKSWGKKQGYDRVIKIRKD